ncbi:hypothetical protein G6F23_006353 [Rhizopus arrhizus]|nr:hypothetical protein G6F23_006353 [Rhizopus arrhizus]
MSKINFSTHGKDIQAAYDAVINEKDDTNWLIYAFDKGTYDLRVQATGDDGLEGLNDEFSDGKIQFAYAKVRDPNTELPKFVFIAWCGSGVPELRKAFFNSQLVEVSKFFKSFHVQINARDEADVEPELIMKRIAESSGANYSVHKEASKPQPKVTPVGSVYKKTEIPDIASMQRQSMTKENMPVPVGTNYKPVVTAPRKLENRWNMAQQQQDTGANAVRAEREKFEREVREREMQKQRVDTEQSRAYAAQEEIERQRQEEEIRAREYEKQQQQEENRRQQQIREEEERAAAEEEQRRQQLERQQREEEEYRRREAEQQEHQQQEEAQRRRQEEEEAQRRRQEEEAQRRRQEEEAQRKHQQEEAERRRQEEEAQRRHKEEQENLRKRQENEAERQRQEQASLQSQLDQTADRAVHASHLASANAALPNGTNGLSAIVLFAYDASEANEMSLEEGEVITEIDQVDEGWWFGISENGKKEGLFPANYVEILEQQQSEPVHEDHHEVSRAAPSSPSLVQQSPTHEEGLDNGMVAVALYDYEAGEDNEISFNEGDLITHIEFASDDWWQGLAPNKKDIGLFPANYVELRQ